MTALDDLKVYLTTTLASKYADTELQHVIQVETDDQANRLRPNYRLADLGLWSAHPSPLREAIMRRCARNLALRKLPLGISESEVSALRVSGRDTEIKRLEAPYLRLVVG